MRKYYLVEYRYYHQREYHNGDQTFRSKRAMNKFIKNLGGEETFIAAYKVKPTKLNIKVKKDK